MFYERSVILKRQIFRIIRHQVLDDDTVRPDLPDLPEFENALSGPEDVVFLRGVRAANETNRIRWRDFVDDDADEIKGQSRISRNFRHGRQNAEEDHAPSPFIIGYSPSPHEIIFTFLRNHVKVPELFYSSALRYMGRTNKSSIILMKKNKV